MAVMAAFKKGTLVIWGAWQEIAKGFSIPVF